MKYVKILILVFLIGMIFVALLGCSSMHRLTDLSGITSYQRDADDKADNDLTGSLLKQRDDYDALKKKCFIRYQAYEDPDKRTNKIYKDSYQLPETMSEEYKILDCKQFNYGKETKTIYH